MALEENNDNTKPVLKSLTPELNTGDELSKRLSGGISTISTPTSKSYIDDKHLDIDAYQKEQQTAAGYKLTPDIYNQNKEAIDAYNKKQEVRLNDYMAYNQGLGAKIGDGLVKFGGRVFTSVAGATAGTLYGLYAWTKDGEFKSFYDNDFQRGLDGINDYLAEEFKHYYTSSKNDWEIGNFVFDKVFDGLGFATGAILSSYAGGGAVGLLSKSFKLTSAIKANSIKKLLDLNKTANTGQAITNTTSTLSNLKNLTNLSQLPKSMVSLTTGAVYESGVEARHSYSETREYLIDIYKQTHEGKSPTGADLDEINKLSGETANGIFAANMVVVGGGNILQFGKHIGLDYKDLTKLIRSSIGKEVISETGEKVIKLSGSKFVRGTKAVIKNPIVESQEEMLQSVISGTGKDYTATKYRNDGKADLNDLLDSSIKSFKKVYNSSEGWEEGLIGAIVGSTGVITARSSKNEEGKFQIPIQQIGGIRESVKDWRQSEIKRDEIITRLNEQGSINSLKSSIQHNIRDSRTEKIKDKAIELNDEMLYKNAQDDQFHSFVTSRIDAGMIGSVYSNLNELRNQPLDDFKKSFGIPEEHNYTEQDRVKQLDSFERRAKAIEKSIEFVDKVYQGNDPDVRESIIYNQSMVNRISERMNTLSNEIQDLTGGSAVALNTVDEKGQKLSKAKIFENVPKQNKVNAKLYEKMYDDYLSLSNRSDLMLEELMSLLNTKEESEIEKEIKENRDKVKKQTETKKSKKQKEDKLNQKEAEAQKIKEQKAAKQSEIKDTEELEKASKLEKEVKPNPNEISIPAQEQVKLIKNIWDAQDQKQITDLLTKLGYEVNNLPLNVKDAIDKKIKELQKNKSKYEKQNEDPLNTTGEVVVDDAVKFDIIEAVNNGSDINIAPKDFTKDTDATQQLNESNQGNKISGINNEDIKDDGLQNVNGRLIDAFNTVATNTRPFVEEDGKKRDLDELNTEANLDVLSSELLQAGDTVTIELFTEPTLLIYNTDGSVKEEKVNDFGINQIMVVKDDNNRIIGYLHEDSYINENRVYSENNNLQRNKEQLKINREKVFNHINATAQPFKSKILSKSAGRVFTLANKRYDNPLFNAIKNDKRPQLLIVKEDGFYLGKSKLSNTELSDKLIQSFDDEFFTKYKGSTMIALPSANGQYILQFVRNTKLVEMPQVSKLITDTMIAFVEGDIEYINNLGIEYNNQSVTEFIQQFIYTDSDIGSAYRIAIFEDGNIRFTDIEGQAIALHNPENQMKYGPNKANLIKLKERIDNSYLAVNAKLLDGNPSIKTKNDKGITENIKYIDFLKQNLKVNFTGNEIDLSNGKKEIVYTVNPVIALDFEGTSQTSTTDIKSSIEPIVEEITVKQSDSEATKAVKNSTLSKLRKKKSVVENKIVSLSNEDISEEEVQSRKKQCK